MDDYRRWRGGTFYETVTAAVSDVADHGYDSQARLDFWMEQISRAAERAMGSSHEMSAALKARLDQIYQRAKRQADKAKPSRESSFAFRPEKIKAEMKADLARRVMASANLIKLNREEAKLKTIQRFSGWCSSVPPGGVMAEEKRKIKADIGKALKQLPFEERRVLIDQGNKFAASLDHTIAEGGGAIAVIWHSNWKRLNYHYRQDHKERDKMTYVLKDGWAYKDGYIKSVDGFYDDIDGFAQAPFCQCFGEYLYNLGDLPAAMLTEKGQEFMASLKSRKSTS